MQNPESESGFLFRLPFAAMAIMFALAVAATQSAQAQTFTDLHSFTNHGDGNSPFAGPTMDRAGNIYGVTLYGGAGHGTAFKLSKPATGSSTRCTPSPVAVTGTRHSGMSP